MLIFAGCADENDPGPNRGNPPDDDIPVAAAAPGIPDAPLPDTDIDIIDISDKKLIFDDGYVFSHNGVDIYMGEYIENILPGLGTGSDNYLSESCTSEGMMITYVYGGFELAAFALSEGDEYRIFMITIHDDSVTTPEGIYIGHAAADMIAAYGENYEYMPGFERYTYKKNGTKIDFEIDNGVIIYITYVLTDI